MKISEMIFDLNRICCTHGDLEVTAYDYRADSFDSARPYVRLHLDPLDVVVIGGSFE